MAIGVQTMALVAALYVSDYDTADLSQLRQRASSDVHAVVAELVPLVLAVAATEDGTVRAARFDPDRFAACERVAVTVLGALALADLCALLGLPAG